MLRCPVGFRNTIQKWSTTNLEAVCAVGHGDLARTIRRVFSYQQAMDHCFAAELFWRALPNRLAWLSGASQQEKCLKKATSSGAILIGAEDCFENSWKNLNVSKFFESSRDQQRVSRFVFVRRRTAPLPASSCRGILLPSTIYQPNVVYNRQHY